MICLLTSDVEPDVVCVVVVLGADLTLIDAVIHWSDVLNYQTPFVRSLIVVHADSSVWCKWIHTDRQRVDLFVFLPRHLRYMAPDVISTMRSSFKPSHVRL